MNPLLTKAEAAYRAKIQPDMQSAVDRIIKAGMLIMHSPGTHDMMRQQLLKPGDPAENAGEGIAKLTAILFGKSKGTMPIKAAIPAANILLCEGLDFMEQAGLIKVDNNTLAEAAKELGSSLMQMFKVTPERLAQASQQTKQGGAQQPPQATPALGIINRAQGGM